MLTELTPDRLRRVFSTDVMSCDTTADLEASDTIIGQDRAVRALRFGLDIDSVGFNVFVAGPSGIGKMSALASFLEDLAKARPAPPDICYLYNFDEPYEPRAIELPAKLGRQLQRDMKSLLEQVREELPKSFEGDDYSARREAILASLNRQRERVMKEVQEEVKGGGFALQASEVGLLLIPVRDGQPMTDAVFEAMPDVEKQALTALREQLQGRVKETMKSVRALERLGRSQVKELDRAVAGFLVSNLIDDLDDAYASNRVVTAFVRQVQKDILENLDRFRGESSEGEDAAPETPGFDPERFFRRYQVNVLVDNSDKQGAPVVVELNPSYPSLFGRIEKEAEFGTLQTDFTLIKSGSMHRANGGFLIIPIEDVLRAPASWDALKRTLRGGTIEIEDLAERMGAVSIKGLRPQPIPARVKVIVVGRPHYHYLLHANDDEFDTLFKVKADFDTSMDCNDQNIADFVRFASALACREGLRHLDRGGVARLLECAVRRADDQAKLSTEFGAIADLMREANHWAGSEGAERVGSKHVDRAVDEQRFRAGLVNDRYQEMIATGMLLIATGGRAVGQLNGLSVVSLGSVRFGRPARITASVGPGRRGVIDIEREVELGGPSHSKGVLILQGFLFDRFGRDNPLSLEARLAFEQSYDGVDGDSASSTELYALLSALSGLPIKQGIAVTGSVNQRGEVQAIGGVNEKIEGYFDVCVTHGLNGEQGVMIPASNVQNLMLRVDIVAAVAAAKFRIWSVAHVDQGIELLTSVSAGARTDDGGYPAGSVNHLVAARLEALAKTMREHHRSDVGA